MTKSVLLVDDNPWIREAMADCLKEHLGDIAVTVTGDGREALEIVSSRPVDMLITEVDLPGMNGYELIDGVRQQKPGMPIVVTTDDCSLKIVEILTSLKVNKWIEKPFDGNTIASAVKHELSRIA